MVGLSTPFMVLLLIVIWFNLSHSDISWNPLWPWNYNIFNYLFIYRGADSTRRTIIFKKVIKQHFCVVYLQSTATTPSKYGFFVTFSFERIGEKIMVNGKNVGLEISLIIKTSDDHSNYYKKLLNRVKMRLIRFIYTFLKY